jgi:tetratricopeptide (TPR) repeat protein
MAELWSPTRLGKGDSTRCLQYLDQAEACSSIDLEDVAQIAGCRAAIAVLSSDFTQADEWYRKAEDAFEKAGDTEQFVLHLAYHSSVFLGQGRTREARKLVDRAFEVLENSPCLLGKEEASHYLGVCRFCTGEAEQALDAFKQTVDIALKLGDYGALVFASIDRALIYDSIGDLEKALSEARFAHEIASRTESKLLSVATKALLVHEEVRNRDLDRAGLHCLEARRLAKDFHWGFRSVTRGLLAISQGEMLLSKGEDEPGFALIERGISHVRGAPEGLMIEAMARSWSGDWARDAGMMEKAAAQYREAAAIYRRLGNEPQVRRLPLGEAESERPA